MISYCQYVNNYIELLPPFQHLSNFSVFTNNGELHSEDPDEHQLQKNMFTDMKRQGFN